MNAATVDGAKLTNMLAWFFLVHPMQKASRPIIERLFDFESKFVNDSNGANLRPRAERLLGQRGMGVHGKPIG